MSDNWKHFLYKWDYNVPLPTLQEKLWFRNHHPLRDIYMVHAFLTLAPTCSACHLKDIQLLSENWPEQALWGEVQVGQGFQSFSANQSLSQVNPPGCFSLQSLLSCHPRAWLGTCQGSTPAGSWVLPEMWASKWSMGCALGQYGGEVAEKPQRALAGELSIFGVCHIGCQGHLKLWLVFTMIFMMACHLDGLLEIYVYLISFLLCS